MLDSFPETGTDIAGHPRVVQDGRIGTVELPHRIVFEKSHYTSNRYFFAAYFRGEKFVTSYQPLHDGCRELKRLGFSGRVKTWWRHREGAAMTADIEQAAQLRIVKTATAPSRLAKFKPFSDRDDIDRPDSCLPSSGNGKFRPRLPLPMVQPNQD